MEDDDNTKSLYEMSASLFIDIYTNKQKDVAGFEKYYGKNEISEEPQIIFENVQIKEAIEINNLTISSNLLLKNCDISSFNILKSRCRNIYVLSSAISWINFEDSKLEALFLSDESRNGEIWIDKSLIHVFTISDNTICDGIRIYESQIDECYLDGSTIKDILVKSNFSVIKINQIITTDLLEFEDCNIGTLVIGDISGLDKFQVNKSYIESLLLKFINPTRIYFNEVSFSNINLNQTQIPQGSILAINDCSANNISMNQTLIFSSVYIGNLKPLELIQNFKTNSGDIIKDENGMYVYENINRETLVSIQNSDLGKTSFINCDLSLFKRFEFYNSNLLSILLIGSSLPQKIDVQVGQEINLHVQQQLAYSQFKKVFQNSGNNIAALEYRAKELEIYRRHLTKDKKNNFAELVNLWTIRFSSFYGTKWLRALLLTIIISITSYSIYCLLLGNSFGNDYHRFLERISYIGEFINPVHNAEALESKLKVVNKGSYTTSIARIWNYISRILIAFMIYETIQAYRKHNKSAQ